MTKRKQSRNDKNVTKRMTPKDLENERLGVFVEKVEKSPPRKATPAEEYANNNTPVEFFKAISSVKHLVPIFDSELKEMNKGKVGRPYQFSNSEILWIMALLTAMTSTFRYVAGIAESVLDLVGIRAPSYSRLFERARDMADEIYEKTKNGDGIFIIVACSNVIDRIRNVGIDSSGINLSDTTLWRSKKWGTNPVDRGWLKLHVLCDVDTNEIIAYAITTESVGDAPLLKILMKQAIARGHKIGTVYADGAYSSVENFRFVCGEVKSKFVTSFRSNTLPKNMGSIYRGDAAKLWCKLPYNEWVKVSGYGRRWKCEVVFSDFKRLFPETVTAHTIDGAIRQIAGRVDIFNKYKAMRAKNVENYRCCAVQ